MGENKTKRTPTSSANVLATIDSEEKRADCTTILQIMEKLTGEPPALWGQGIIGFGLYHYRYESGREGDWFLTGFAPRKNDISIYLIASGPDQPGLLARLGRHRMGKSCLYIRRLSDVDLAFLEQLVSDSVAEVRRLHA